MWIMELRKRLQMLVVVLLITAAACGSEGAPSDVGSDGPPITESETGRVVGQGVDVEAFRVDVTEEETAVFLVSGTVPSPCHEAVYGFEEPDADGVMVGTAESWFDSTCTLIGGATAFSVPMELNSLEPGEYVARLDGGFEAHFSIPARTVNDAVGDLRSASGWVVPDPSGFWASGLTIDWIPPGFTFKTNMGTADEARSWVSHVFASEDGTEFDVGRQRFASSYPQSGQVVTVHGREFTIVDTPAGTHVTEEAGGDIRIIVFSIQMDADALLEIAKGVTYDPASDDLPTIP
jgi:hypothetical protein